MLDHVLWPIRTVRRAVESEVSTPLEETEHEILDAVDAIHRATDSIERHVEVIDGLASSVGPLTDSVDRLTATMRDLVELLAPMAAAERDVQRAERFFRLRRQRNASGPESPGPGS